MEPFFTPLEIEQRSFAIIDEEAGENKPFVGNAWEIARRLVHTTGDFAILHDLILPDDAIQAGVDALQRGAPIYTDTEMVRMGIPLRRLKETGNTVQCILSLDGVAEEATRKNSTRSRAGMLLLGDKLDGAIVAVGNAPTALLALLERVEKEGIKPALVIGMPVGFVNAAESKDMLLQQTSLKSLVVKGRRGGSPLAATTVNALACML